MIANGNVARLGNGFEAFEPACVLDHAPLVAMPNLVLLLTRDAAVREVDEQQATQKGETLDITHFLEDKDSKHKVEREQDEVLEDT